MIVFGIRQTEQDLPNFKPKSDQIIQGGHSVQSPPSTHYSPFCAARYEDLPHLYLARWLVPPIAISALACPRLRIDYQSSLIDGTAVRTSQIGTQMRHVIG